MPTDGLEGARARFLDQLHSSELNLSDHGAFLAYWQQVEQEAQASEDLAQLDRWVKDLSRDKDRVAELKSRQQQAASSQMGAAETVNLLHQILALLDDIFDKLRRRRNSLHDHVAWWVFLAGPGSKSKPVPKDDEAPAEKKDGQVRAVNLAAEKKKEGPKKTKAG
jgi:hypothetical protein